MIYTACIVLACINLHVSCLCPPPTHKWTVETCAQNCYNASHAFFVVVVVVVVVVLLLLVLVLVNYHVHRNIQDGAAHFSGSGQAVSRGVLSQPGPVAGTEDTEAQTSGKEETSHLLQPG